MAGEAPEVAPSAAMIAAFDQIDELARDLYHRADQTTLWCALDHPTQLYWRKMAARKLQEAIRKSA